MFFLAATAEDFQLVDKVLRFQSRESLCVNVTILDDDVVEDSEIFGISVSSSDPNVTLGAIPRATIVIFDNDGKFSVMPKS